MSKNKHILILYSVLALALLFIGYGLLQPTAEANVKINKSSQSDNRTFFWEIYPELVIPNSGKIIDKELKLRDQHDEDISIRKVLKNASLLVFRYSRYDCDLCIDQVLDKLKTVKANQIFTPFREHPAQTDTYLKNIKAQLRD